MEFSEDQLAALDAIERWFGRGSEPYFTVGGWAGTGKTTIIAEIKRRYRGRDVRVAAYTGKAAYVLRTKGVNASTIHSLIYAPVEVCLQSKEPSVDCGLHEKMVDVFGAKIPTCKDVDTEFRRVPELSCGLIVVDEASMVSTEIFEDLLSFKIPLLFIGDHGQLEPIGRNPGLMRDPLVKLERIHRQAEGSPILQFAHRVRRGFAPSTTGDAARVEQIRTAPRNLDDFDAVLVGRNATRVEINKKMRRLLGYEGELPCPGERVICLRNDKMRGIFNGMIATVREIDSPDDGSGISMTVTDDLGEVFSDMPIAPEQFNSEKTLDKEISRRKTLWDYGYCMTVHKAQGSEWSSVCVLEWIHRDWSAERWRYTAATRAVDELLYCVNPGR